jgi:methionyl-tRNA formyltransferase
MHVIRELDAGDIISKKIILIGPQETGGELHDRLADLGPSALDEALEILATNPKAGTPQNPDQVTYAPKLLREHGRLDFTQSAETLQRTIRAYEPWPGTFTEVSAKGKSKRLKIFPPTSISEHPLPAGELLYQNGELIIGCGNQSLVLSEVQPEGSKRMSAQAFANSL